MLAISQNMETWNNPGSYGGFSPVNDWVVLGQSRDSDVLDQSNYITVFEALKSKSIELECQANGINGEGEDCSMVYDYRASHWACGWVETLLICSNAPQELIDFADEIMAALSDYPVFDESDFSEREWEYATEVWQNCYDTGERIELIKEYGDGNIFAARHDHIPEDPSGMLFDTLRTP